jgi:hypothetical protein
LACRSIRIARTIATKVRGERSTICSGMVAESSCFRDREKTGSGYDASDEAILPADDVGSVELAACLSRLRIRIKSTRGTEVLALIPGGIVAIGNALHDSHRPKVHNIMKQVQS